MDIVFCFNNVASKQLSRMEVQCDGAADQEQEIPEETVRVDHFINKLNYNYNPFPSKTVFLVNSSQHLLGQLHTKIFVNNSESLIHIHWRKI